MPQPYDIVCLSHLRWDFVYQRPQHLLSRFAKHHRVFYIEEPVFDAETPHLELTPRSEGVTVVVPHLPKSTSFEEREAIQTELIGSLIEDQDLRQYILWFYTPMAMPIANLLSPIITVFDCMDELSAFAGASPLMLERENELFSKANIVFTGGESLFRAKKDRHANIHALPSSVDVAHFSKALSVLEEPQDQSGIGHPRIGFFGVIDERMDLHLLREIARLRPDWQYVILGPVVKIDASILPIAPNLHYLGGKSYAQLPDYIASWDVAMLPFAINESTRFISPTKTPEYMAAGRPVVSTPIKDVVHPYGDMDLVRIAATPEEFVEAIGESLKEDPRLVRERNRSFLENMSWDNTWKRMAALIDAAIERA